MARHLYIGNNVAVARTVAGKLDNGAIEIQKLTQNGPAAMSNTDTIADSPQFRIVQGNGTRDIVSPWIYGKDVINWSGKSYVAAAAQTSTLLCVTTAAATVGGKELDIKFVYLNGPRQEFFKFSTTIVASSVIADSGQAIIDAFNALANVPDWLNPTATLSTATVTFTGAKRGDVAQSGNVWDYEPVVFKTIIGNNPVTTQTYTIVDGVINATPGYGDGFAVKAFEESLMGNQYGYYNRIAQPITPVSTVDTGETYDMYNIVATKDGSSSSQINGVDNLIEISIAFDNDTGALTSALQGVLNPYMASVGFANVNL